MRIRLTAGSVRAAALLAATAAVAETSAPRVTDVGPAPAEERDSVGAVVLENSLVRARRSQAFNQSAARTGVGSVGRGVLRSTTKAQAELASARAEEAADFRRRGAGALTGQ